MIERPSADQEGRRLAVSPKVSREKGPLGICLIQMALLPFWSRSTARARPSFESENAAMVPCGCQVESTALSTPSRVTHIGFRLRTAAPVV